MKKNARYLMGRINNAGATLLSTLHPFLKKTGILHRLGFYAIGEKNHYRISPFYLTVDVENADEVLVFGQDGAKLPIPDHRAKIIYSSHNLEHLPDEDAEKFFSDSFRALKSGGELLIEVPDAEYLYKEYLAGKWEAPNANVAKDTNGLFKTLHESFISSSAKEYLKKARGEQVAELAEAPYITFIGTTSFFVDPPYDHAKGSMVPPIVNKNEFETALKTLPMDDFFNWCINLLSKSQITSGGHCSAWYPDKLFTSLKKHGFEPSLREFREAKTVNWLPPWFRVPDRRGRNYYSFRVSAIKP